MHNILPIILCIGLFLSMASAQGELEKLPSSVNTDALDETSPVISKKGDKLFFTRTADPEFEGALLDENGEIASNKEDIDYKSRLSMIFSQLAGHHVDNPGASVFNQDIWIVSLEEDQPGRAIHPGYPLNNALPNSLVSVGMGPNEYVLLNQFYEDGSMHAGFSRIQMNADESFQPPKPMFIYDFNLTSADVDLTMSPDGQVLVMSMQRNDGLGLNDLYVSFYIRNNLWSAPMHMGDGLNTPFQESSPHISPDKRFLYFSTNKPGGAGGNDIYVSERLNYSWKKWSEPQPVKGNVNTSHDESQPYFDPSGDWLYFNSKRDGSSDIFRQRQTPMPKLKAPVFVRGKILSAETGLPVHSELFWGQQSSTEFLEYFNTYTGEFEISLTEYEPYKFQLRKANHTAQKISIDPRQLEKQGIDTLDLILYLHPKNHQQPEESIVRSINQSQNPIEKAEAPVAQQTITFYDINFLKGKATIMTKSRPALKFIHQMLDENPDMEILIEGHTDNVGDELALVDLSLQRAEAIRNYMVHQGVECQRMHVAGRGATKALYHNSTESGRAKNRRVEISVIK